MLILKLLAPTHPVPHHPVGANLSATFKSGRELRQKWGRRFRLPTAAQSRWPSGPLFRKRTQTAHRERFFFLGGRIHATDQTRPSETSPPGKPG
ncbi:hypothetical protein SBA4_1630016 [Candidatus Sulfopaludibacter sp. SbA4]|nr:hypothetical protein SBA4_1630016 [Candidatus Sulfopaludibacter sp. SbA4]